MRIKQLDAFRAVAILLVIAHHYGRPVPPLPLGLDRALGAVFERGWAGVDLFFVISGFLIAGLLFAEYKSRGELDLKRFFVRRGFKIYPPFYVLLAATLLVNWLTHEPSPRAAVLSEAVFFQNYGPGLWVHTWSLGVEEQFYVTLPFGLCLLASLTGGLPRLYRWRYWLLAAAALGALLLAISVRLFTHAQERVFFSLMMGAVSLALLVVWGVAARRWRPRLGGAAGEEAGGADPFRQLPHTFLFVALLATAMRAATALYLPEWNSKSHSFPAHLHMDSLMFGVTLAYFQHFRGDALGRFVARRRGWIGAAVAASAVAVFAFEIRTSFFFQVFGFALLYVLWGGLLLLSLGARRGEPGRVSRALAAIGVYSYSVYLWHVPLGAWVFARLVGPEPAAGAYFLGLAAYVLTSVVAGVVLAKLIEQPALRLRERLFPAPARPVTQTVAPLDETNAAAPAFGERFAATEAAAGGGASSGR